MEVLQQWARAISAAGGGDDDVALLLGATEVRPLLWHWPTHAVLMKITLLFQNTWQPLVHVFVHMWARLGGIALHTLGPPTSSSAEVPPCCAHSHSALHALSSGGGGCGGGKAAAVHPGRAAVADDASRQQQAEWQ